MSKYDIIDEIAVAAMVGILANPGHLRGEANKTAPLVAVTAYDYAEAMVAEAKRRRAEHAGNAA